MIEKIQPYWKAVVAFFAPGLLILAAGPLASGTIPSQGDWLMALGVALSTSLAVFVTPNIQRRYTPEHTLEETS